MRLTGSRAYARPAPTPTMPPGLVELMEGLAKDVVKNNPESVYEFCAGHMQKLLEIRDGPVPPKKQLSLEQKIAIAQEKIRQRLSNRQFQRDTNTSEQSNENNSLGDKRPLNEVPIESTAVQPVVEITNENTSSLEKNAIENTSIIQSAIQTAIENTSVTQPVVHGEKLVMANEVEIFHEPDVIITTNDTSADEASHAEHDNGVQSKETSQVGHKLKDDVVIATQQLEYPTEKVFDEVKENVLFEITQLSNIEVIAESKNYTNGDERIKNDVDTKVEDIKHAENTPQIADNNKTQLNESKLTVSEIGNKDDDKIDNLSDEENTPQIADNNKTQLSEVVPTVSELGNKDENKIDNNLNDEENTPQIADNNKTQLSEVVPTVSEIGNKDENKIDNLNDEVLKKELTKDELIEVVSTSPLINNNDSIFSHIDDAKKMEKEVVEEEKIIIKEEFTDTWHEEILIGKYANKIEPIETINAVLEEQEIAKKEEYADRQPKVILAEKDDNIEFKGSTEGIMHTSEEDIVEKDHDKFLPQTEDIAVGESTINQLETTHHTETVPEENVFVRSADTKILEVSNPQDSETNTESTENQVITVEMTEKATDAHDVQKDEVKYEPKVDKELNDNNIKLPEQESAYGAKFIVKDTDDIQDYTTALNKNDTIIDSDETPENTAVSGMDLETAAITIQKVFRTFLFSKSRASTLDDTVNENCLDEDVEKKEEPEYILTSSNLNKERRTLGISRMDTVLQTVNEEKSLSLSDDSSLSSAATTIQAHVRGFLVRNRLASNKTASSTSIVNSDGQSTLSLDGDVNEPKKTILNIHIVPERGQFMSRDESLMTSIDLPLDNSPPSSINLHPLGYDKSAERRKQLKREDAVQSISPPSNNSVKFSEEIDPVKEAVNDSVDVKQEHESIFVNGHEKPQDADSESCDTTLTISSTAETVVEADSYIPREILSSPDHNVEKDNKVSEGVTSSSDEMDVVTPYSIPEKTTKVASVESENDEKPKLVHSGEFHDMVVQTQVKRSESSVVREFKNVLVYFLLWDKT